ncbi:AAA family ATPase [Nocardioides jensenii]|uniref:AAA family ATPase n=1 Tax=Nocardioides jensenii TaxID=1843 RepID=UPI000833A713|nr:AAA family ATPase [Nocardioides jensenii]
MATLIHLNGAPGVGKSTIARRYAERNPGVLNCDVDVLRTMIGGWRADFEGVGALIRPVALAMLAEHLRHGNDVVLPQMLVRGTELARFREAALGAGAGYLHILLDAPPAVATDRFYGRPADEPLHATIRGIVDEAGGPEQIAAYHRGLEALAQEVPGTRRVPADGDVEATCAALRALCP